MRKIGLYQIRDNKAEMVAGPIMAAKAEAVAVREFTKIIRNTDTMPGQHPEDYDLMKIGDQDEETGQVSAQLPTVILNGKTYLDSMTTSEPSAERGN